MPAETEDWQEPELSPEGVAYQGRSGPPHTEDSGTMQAALAERKAESEKEQAEREAALAELAPKPTARPAETSTKK